MMKFGYGWLNIGSLLFGLLAWFFPIMNFRRQSKGEHKHWVVFSLMSVSACSVSLCMQHAYANYLVSKRAWATLMDISGASLLVSFILVLVTLMLNAMVFIRYNQVSAIVQRATKAVIVLTSIVALATIIIYTTGINVGRTESETVNHGRIYGISSISDMQNIHPKDGGYEYVYFGRPTCQSCERFLTILEMVVSDKGIDIHYFNTDYFKHEEGYQEIMEMYGVDRVPMLIKMSENGAMDTFSIDENDIDNDSIKDEESIYEQMVNFLEL